MLLVIPLFAPIFRVAWLQDVRAITFYLWLGCWTEPDGWHGFVLR
jgi:hypothetical protein